MKKISLFLVALSMLFFSCNYNSSSKENSTETIEVIEEEHSIPTSDEVSLNESMPKDLEKFFALYKELLGFKDKSDFKQLGFSPNGSYYKWYEQVNALSKTAEISHFTKYGFVPGDLITLGLEYVSTNGKENDVTNYFCKNIEKGLKEASGVKEEKSVSRDNETVIGHWKISGVFNMDVQIVKRGSQFYAIENGREKKLTKRGDKYMEDDSMTGAYYKIENGQLRVCDEQGDIVKEFNLKVETIND